jgi:hypothetical protein
MMRQQKERNEDEEISSSNAGNNFSTRNRRRVCCDIDIDINDTDTSITKKTPLLSRMLILFLLLLVTTSIATTTKTISSSTTHREDDDNNISIIWQRNLVEEEEQEQQEEITPDGDVETETETTINIPKTLFLSVWGIVLGLISSIFVIGSWIFIYCHRNNPIVSLGQPPFMYLICFGSLLLSSSLFFETGMANNFINIVKRQHVKNSICVIKLWFQHVGIIIVYMSLFCKLWRAEQVTQFRRGNTVLVRHVIGPFFLILIIQIGILIGQTIVTPPYWKDVPVHPHNIDDPHRIETCYQINFDDPISVAFNASSVMILVLCEIITMWMACRTRKIREDISDSWRVFQTMCFQIIISIPYVLLMNGLVPSGKLYYIIEIGYPFLLAMSSTGFIIIPKMYFVFYKRKYGHLPDHVQSPVGIGRTVVSISGSGNNTTRDNSNNTERISASRSTISTRNIPPPSRTDAISSLDEKQRPNNESSLPSHIQEEQDEEQP